jgi:acid phosphatase
MTLSPVPLPMQIESVVGNAVVRYQVRGEVTFQDVTGLGGRINQVTLGFAGQGERAPQKVGLDLALPPGGTIKYQISQTVDLAVGEPPSVLQLTATGLSQSGNALLISSVQAPITMIEPAGTGMFNHVFVVVEENEGHDKVIGGADMPYLNSLATQYGLATEYYANTHPSIGNYFMLTVGNIVTNSSNHSSIVSDDNIVRQLVAAGKTWKSYVEDLPDVGYIGGDSGLYARRHNVFALLSDVAGSAAQARNLTPFTRFAMDVAAGTFPNYSFIVPNLCNNGHDCPLRTADDWLQANIAPLVSNPHFQRDGLLIITFDEAADSDRTNGGGRVAWVAVSGRSKRGYRSTRFYQHQSTLRLTAEALGLTFFPNRAAEAPDMTEFFY